MPPLQAAESARLQLELWQAILMQTREEEEEEEEEIRRSKPAACRFDDQQIRAANRIDGGPDIRRLRPVGTLGRGNMGMVVLVLGEDDDGAGDEAQQGAPRFAMKVTKKNLHTKAARRSRRAHTERDILASLRHPFLQTLHAHFESDKHSLLLLDFCPGGDLNVLRHKQPDKRFTETAARFYAAEVLHALEHLHKLGIVYRDLKPENILIQESGHVMLTDFDLSLKLPKGEGLQRLGHSRSVKHRNSVMAFPQRRQSNERQKKCGLSFCGCLASGQSGSDESSREKKQRRGVIRSCKLKLNTGKKQLRATSAAPAKRGGAGEDGMYVFVGTEEYVAPEILQGAEHGCAVDWWTFGILLYELVYGTTPFKGRRRRETFANILDEEPQFPGAARGRPLTPLQDLVQRLLAKDPARRPGAADIKSHPFFEGLRWDSLEHVSRPPFIPPPFSLAHFQERAKRRAAAQAAAKAQQQAAAAAAAVSISANYSSSYFGGASASSRKEDSSSKSSSCLHDANGASSISTSFCSDSGNLRGGPQKDDDDDDDDLTVEEIFTQCARYKPLITELT